MDCAPAVHPPTQEPEILRDFRRRRRTKFQPFTMKKPLAGLSSEASLAEPESSLPIALTQSPRPWAACTPHRLLIPKRLP